MAENNRQQPHIPECVRRQPLMPDPTKGLVMHQPDPVQMHCRIEQLAAQIVVLTARLNQLEAEVN